MKGCNVGNNQLFQRSSNISKQIRSFLLWIVTGALTAHWKTSWKRSFSENASESRPLPGVHTTWDLDSSLSLKAQRCNRVVLCIFATANFRCRCRIHIDDDLTPIREGDQSEPHERFYIQVWNAGCKSRSQHSHNFVRLGLQSP
jgi:hypothetical protein